MTSSQDVWEMRRELGQQLAAPGTQAGLTQRELAPLTGYARSTLSDAELGRHHIARDFWERSERALDAGTVLTDRYDQIEAAAAAARVLARQAAQAARHPREPARPESLPQGGAIVQACPVCHHPLNAILVLTANPRRSRWPPKLAEGYRPPAPAASLPACKHLTGYQGGGC
jgi:transcriptional regulator with XRE-family HTH domain